MWEPEPGWHPLPRGASSSTLGVWKVTDAEGTWVVKRLTAPEPGDAPELSDTRHYAWWRREVEVATGLELSPGSGLTKPAARRTEEDDAGATLWTAYAAPGDVTGPYAARALGRFAAQELPDRAWWTCDLLADRLRRTEEHDGWPTLARTTVADLADALWSRRRSLLARYADLPHGPSHGDPAPANLIAPVDEGDVVAIDWRMAGRAPFGADLGYYSLAAREDVEVLLGAWLDGHRAAGGAADPDDVRFAARLMAVYTVMGQAEWALARVARGEGALAAKYRHPAVAPYLRALQRQFPQIEALLDVA